MGSPTVNEGDCDDRKSRNDVQKIMSSYPQSLSHLITALEKLPGVGPKTAERYALFLTHYSPQRGTELIETLIKAKAAITFCERCFNVADASPCALCTNPKRDQAIVCVVASPPDVIAYERTGEFHGVYHILQGLINPLENISASQLRIKELVSRVATGTIKEIILGLNPTVEGEVTSTYLSKLLTSPTLTITRIARGLPMGASVEYADDATLAGALRDRKKY